MDKLGVADLLGIQHRVISRRQVLGAGGSDVDIERRIRRREWAHVQHGVYADHTGPLDGFARSWAAVLCCWPAALGGSSALGVHGLRMPGGDDPRVEVVIDQSRRLDPGPGIRVTRSGRFAEIALLHLEPPRVRLEYAVLTVASRARGEDGAVAVLADACQTRRTTPERLRLELVARPRLVRRRFLGEVLGDAAEGAWSALERRYLVRVESAHDLPHAERQRVVRPGRSVAHRDVDYLGMRTVVELDGRLGHEWNAERWGDLQRDIDSVVAGDLTLRVGWRHVLEPCRLAGAVAAVLLARGWSGSPRPCRHDCPLAGKGGSPAPGAEDPPLSPV